MSAKNIFWIEISLTLLNNVKIRKLCNIKTLITKYLDVQYRTEFANKITYSKICILLKKIDNVCKIIYKTNISNY